MKKDFKPSFVRIVRRQDPGVETYELTDKGLRMIQEHEKEVREDFLTGRRTPIDPHLVQEAIAAGMWSGLFSIVEAVVHLRKKVDCTITEAKISIQIARAN